MKRNDNFRFFMPVNDIKKSKDKKGNDVYKVSGIISDSSEDSDGEFLDPSGFDMSEFNYINWNHGKNPNDIIGEPEKWKNIPGKGMYMEGYIYPDSEKGQQAVELMKVLRNSKKGNQLGWSVEGQVLERDLLNDKKVKRARITAVALCPFPKNGNTFAELLQKGFVDDQQDEDLEFEETETGNIIEETDENGDTMIVDSEGNLVVKKAQSVENSAPVIREHVEGNEDDEKEELKRCIVNVVKAHQQGLATDEQLEKCQKLVKYLE